jgi:hypothetical protein
LTLVAVNALLFCALAEGASLFLYYIDTGGLYYTSRPVYELPTAPIQEGRLTGEALHPYFGPTHKPGVPFDVPASLRAPDAPPVDLHTNNFGFVSAYDYPFTRQRDNQFVVGLFGGSVGLWFCAVGAERLLADLKQDPFFRDKELIPLCFSHEGYKQPQQLLVLTYFLEIGQPLDLVVNIDGFNDVALAHLNDERGLDISMPSVQHMEGLINLVNQATVTPEKLESLTAIQRFRTRLTDLASRAQRAQFAAVHVVLDRLYRRTADQYSRELGRFNNLPSNPSSNSLIQATPSVRRREGNDLYVDIANQWVRASLLMNDLLAARGVPYFHFLQPNQYLTTRKFSDAEARVALSDESPYKRAVGEGYPALLSAASLLDQKEHFFNATMVFDREPAQVYMDNCCHYTRTGNVLLADFIAKSIRASPGPWSGKR